MRRLTKISLLACTAAAFCCASARAVTLDWNAVTWTNGSLSNSYDIDPNASGADVTVAVSGNTAQLGPEQVSPYQQTPALTTNLQGGLPTAKNTLTILLDLSTTSQSVTVSVNFSAQYTQGVNNVSFTIFDVDFANVNGASGAKFTDEIRSVVGVAADGTLVAGTLTPSADNKLIGTGFDAVVDGINTTGDTGAGSASNGGNVTVSFGSTPIKSFSLVYGSGPTVATDPTAQHIGISDISFTPVPEVNPSWAAAFSCLAAGYLIRRHNARVRK
jgi:hypothetical protein